MTDRNETGLCLCGCGQQTWIATQNNPEKGWVKGEPVRYLRGHAPKTRDHALTEIDPDARTAVCSRCGPTPVYKTKETKAGWRCSTAKGHKGEHRKVHRLTNIDQEALTATCANCGPVEVIRDREFFYCKQGRYESKRRYDEKYWAKPENRARQSAYQKEHYRKTRGAAQRKAILKKYGLTPEKYEAMLAAQGGVCALCKAPPPEGKNLAVDHCHDSSHVRGLLCVSCNTGIGSLRHDTDLLRRAIAYLEATD